MNNAGKGLRVLVTDTIIWRSFYSNKSPLNISIWISLVPIYRQKYKILLSIEGVNVQPPKFLFV